MARQHRKSARPSASPLAPRKTTSKPFAHQPTLRALTLFEELPPGHNTFLVTDDSSEPHLNRGEYAVIDCLDRELQHGEVYLVQSASGYRRRRLAVARSSYCTISGPEAEKSLVWWLNDLQGWRNTGKRVHGIPLFAGLSDGPYRADNLQCRLVGRVLGYAEKSLGKLIAPVAGYHDEIGGNAAFDPVEYLDVLIATGHEPYLYGGDYVEKMPERALSDAEHKRALSVHLKFAEASTALERVKEECRRRGLVARSAA